MVESTKILLILKTSKMDLHSFLSCLMAKFFLQWTLSYKHEGNFLFCVHPSKCFDEDIHTFSFRHFANEKNRERIPLNPKIVSDPISHFFPFRFSLLKNVYVHTVR